MTDYHRHAVAFIKRFPVGRLITHEQFDEWAIRRGLLHQPRSYEVNSDAWLAHLQRRHQTRYNINRAGISRRMLEQELPTFSIDRLGIGDKYEVKPAHIAFISNSTAKKVQTLVRTKRRQLLRIKSGIDFSQLPPYMQALVDSIDHDIGDFRTRVEMEAKMLNDKCLRLASQLQSMIDSGALAPLRDGNLLQLMLPLSHRDHHDEEEDDNGEE